MSAQNRVCRLCHKPNKFARSHIISRSFFLKIRGQYKHAVEVNLDAKRMAVFRQAGNYDQQILCLECESKFNALDTYGYQVLGKTDVRWPILSQRNVGTVEAYRVVGCDTDKLRKFLLSVLWRASVSSLNFYSYVRLGSAFEDEAIGKVFSPNVLPWDQFTMLISKFDDNALGAYSSMLFPPMLNRDPLGTNYYTLYLPGLKIIIKVDHRPTPEFWWLSAIQHPSQFELMRLHGHLVRVEWGYLQQMAAKLQGKRMPR